MTNHITLNADSFRVYTPNEKNKLHKFFQERLTDYGIPVNLSQSIHINIKITDSFPRKVEFDLKINGDEYYYDSSLHYMDLSTKYTPEVYVVADRTAKEFVNDVISENIAVYIESIGEDSINLPQEISFLEAYEYLYNSKLKLGVRNTDWDERVYLIFDKHNKEFIYKSHLLSHKFNPFAIRPEILNNDKWSLFEIKDSS